MVKVHLEYTFLKGASKNAVSFSLSIQLHIDDVNSLHKIKDTLQIGKVQIYRNVAVWQTSKHSELIDTLIPILNYTGLYTAKRFDYRDWAKAINLKNNIPSSWGE